MFFSRFKLLEAFGIPVYVNGSFLFLLILFAIDYGSLRFGLAAAVLLAFSVLVHELAHALTARAFGYRTRDITLSLLGGCASLIALPRKAWQEFLTALAGPAMSFLLAFLGVLALAMSAVDGGLGDALGYIGSIVLGSFGIRTSFDGGLLVPNSRLWIVEPACYLAIMNALLGLFNLLPGFPMDGGRIFRSTMRIFFSRAKATFVAMWVGRAFAILLALRGFHAVITRGPWGFISILIAWMIWREGYREYLMALQDDDFRNWTQDDFRARVSPPPYER